MGKSKKNGIFIRYEWLDDLNKMSGKTLKQLLLEMLELANSGREPNSIPDKAMGLYNKMVEDSKRSQRCINNGKKGGNPHLKGKSKRVAIPLQNKELFEELWRSYPKKIGKLYAKQCFAKCQPTRELLDKMLQALEKQKKSSQWQENNGRYIPNPSTWLNQGRWLDEEKDTPSLELRIGEYL